MVRFDIEKLERILNDFHAVSGMTVSVWDDVPRQLAVRPIRMPRFCRLIKASEKGSRRCAECDKALCLRAQKEGGPVSHRCHAGLTDTAAPIMFENRLLGFMMFGQIKGTDADTEDILRRCAEYKIDAAELAAAYAELQTLDGARIECAGRIVEACASYIWLNDYIRADVNALAQAIDAYITENLTADLSVGAITSRFDVSRNKLYRLTQEYFGTTVNGLILRRRIEAAQKLLLRSDDPVYLISERVGIPDYNYFIKLFRRAAGQTPRAFRAARKV